MVQKKYRFQAEDPDAQPTGSVFASDDAGPAGGDDNPSAWDALAQIVDSIVNWFDEHGDSDAAWKAFNNPWNFPDYAKEPGPPAPSKGPGGGGAGSGGGPGGGGSSGSGSSDASDGPRQLYPHPYEGNERHGVPWKLPGSDKGPNPYAPPSPPPPPQDQEDEPEWPVYGPPLPDPEPSSGAGSDVPHVYVPDLSSVRVDEPRIIYEASEAWPAGQQVVRVRFDIDLAEGRLLLRLTRSKEDEPYVPVHGTVLRNVRAWPCVATVVVFAPTVDLRGDPIPQATFKDDAYNMIYQIMTTIYFYATTTGNIPTPEWLIQTFWDLYYVLRETWPPRTFEYEIKFSYGYINFGTLTPLHPK